MVTHKKKNLNRTPLKLKTMPRMVEVCSDGKGTGRLRGVVLLVVRRVSLDAVSHEESVGAGGDEGMARSHNLKAQETECPQEGCSVIAILVKTDEDVVSL